MITAPLTPRNPGNRAADRETVLYAMDMLWNNGIADSINKIIKQLPAEQAEEARLAMAELNSLLAQAREKKELLERLAEHSFKNTDLTEDKT